MFDEEMMNQIKFTSAVAPPLPLRRFSVEQYHQLGELGVLAPEDRVELLEGWIVEKMNQGPRHGYVVRILQEWLQSRLPAEFIVQCQLPITTHRSEPEPDIAIVRGTHHDFRDRHPAGEECRLLIEVADTSLEKDRAKATIYCSAGVQEYWIVNINEQCIERYQFLEPAKPEQQTLLAADAQISLQVSGTKLVLDLGLIFQ